jgi:hypothetical protein
VTPEAPYLFVTGWMIDRHGAAAFLALAGFVALAALVNAVRR